MCVIGESVYKVIAQNNEVCV